MDAKSLLESMLSDGRSIAAKTVDQAGDRIGLPESGEQRDVMLDGMKKGALAAGALAILLGTGAGRRVGGAALKIGSVAAVGGLAYNAWQKWQTNVEGGKVTRVDPAGADAKQVSELDGDALQSRSVNLVRAMIAAARADGHIDANEKQAILKQMGDQQLPDDVLEFLRTEIESDVDVSTLAALAASPREAAEMYLVARIVIDKTVPVEEQWLNSFAVALELSDEVVADMEAQLG
jgi:uncharacterized membrane protein YebE (DUF533 family)